MLRFRRQKRIINMASRKQRPRSRDKEDHRLERPFVRFRRIARAVTKLLKASKICQSMVLDSVSSEDWFKLIDNFVEGEDKFFEENPVRRSQPFTAYYADESQQELVRLTFDKSEFSRDARSCHLLTDEIRLILKIEGARRTDAQINILTTFMKRMSTDFNAYPQQLQRRLAKCLVYDKYYPSRVICREGVMADCVYFVLAGKLLVKTNENNHPDELQSGDRFGDLDIIYGCPRRCTVVTKTMVELVHIHRLDYRAIFNMADDSNNVKYLEICKQAVVFNHFPMRRLVENPGVWAVLSYKVGSLIAEDSNTVDWIYIIKSGEARVIKKLESRNLDAKARQRRLVEKVKVDPYTISKTHIDFEADQKTLTSQYAPASYCPRRISRCPLSAPVHGRTLRRPPTAGAPASLPATPLPRRRQRQHDSQTRCQSRHDVTRKSDVTGHDVTMGSGSGHAERGGDIRVPLIVTPGGAVENEEWDKYPDTFENTDAESVHEDARQELLQCPEKRKNLRTVGGAGRFPGRPQTADFVQTPLKLPKLGQPRSRSRTAHVPEEPRGQPTFVELESLTAGKAFGFRSCLAPEERGTSASLVSWGCQVLQINRKFFTKHVDEALLGLIKLKYKPFPTEEELLDRLDVTFQWQDYREQLVLDFMKDRGHQARSYHNNRDYLTA